MAQFAVNETGDLTDEEFHQMQGLTLPPHMELEGHELPGGGDALPPTRPPPPLHGSYLPSQATSMNWAETKYGGPVKN